MQGDDVLGVHQPRGACMRDQLAGPAGVPDGGGDDGEQAAGAQGPLAGRPRQAGIAVLAKSLAVIGILIQLGEKTDQLLSSVFSSVSAIAVPGSATLTGALSFSAFESFLMSNDIIRYTGSLTTPPCSESVAWIMGAQTLSIDVHTYNKVKSVVKFNSRYTQNGLGMVNLLENAATELCGKTRRGLS